jgi:hydroxypyruvate reductase
LGKSLAPGGVLVLGGETTVTLNEPPGRGGRNTELALAAALALEGQHHLVVAAVATDGDDGNSGSAGAVVTAETVKMARRLGLNPELALQQHGSATFFAQLDQSLEPNQKTLLHLGPTGVNVNDLLFILKYEI